MPSPCASANGCGSTSHVQTYRGATLRARWIRQLEEELAASTRNVLVMPSEIGSTLRCPPDDPLPSRGPSRRTLLTGAVGTGSAGRPLNADLGDGRHGDMGGTWIGPTQDRIAALATEMGVHAFDQPYDAPQAEEWNQQSFDTCCASTPRWTRPAKSPRPRSSR
jgi:hypothetical protein